MDRKIKSSAPDTWTIDINDEYALEFWAREFNVTHSKLKAAILVAGEAAADVRRQLKKLPGIGSFKA
jgi:hypothetical protein